LRQYRGPRPRPAARATIVTIDYAVSGTLFGNRPHEGDEFSGDRGDRDIRVLAACGQATEAFAQPHLRLPPDILPVEKRPVRS
jgi:hypothetical protein